MERGDDDGHTNDFFYFWAFTAAPFKILVEQITGTGVLVHGVRLAMDRDGVPRVDQLRRTTQE